MLLQVCPNGAHEPGAHPALPVGPEDVAAAARTCVAAGAVEIHLHPKDERGADSLLAGHVDPLVAAIRAAVPDTPLGLSTGAWAVPEGQRRSTLVGQWRNLPDFVSVNWHEPGAEQLVNLLGARGVGIEAGLWTADAAADAARVIRSRTAPDAWRRILVEPDDTTPEGATAIAEAIGDVVGELALPVLLHGAGDSTWPLFDLAARRGLASRIGLEDTFTLPDGSIATDNESLVEQALARAEHVARS
jgi:uncharacterized protein (DUF849 family)